jgi:hypothetical protein
MSITLVKSMAEQFNYRHEANKQAKLSSKDINEPQFDPYRNTLLNIPNKSGFWGKLEIFLAECCDRVFNTHIIASQQEAIRKEIKEVSGMIYSNLPDHSQINATTKKSLCVNKAQGYIIGQEGFKVVAYSGVRILDQKKGRFSYTDKMELIDLTDKNKYNDLMLDLKAVHESKEWKLYLELQTEILTPKSNVFKNASLEFAKDNSARFTEEYEIDISRINENQIEPEQLRALIDFNLKYNYNPGLTKLINRFNSTLLREIFEHEENIERNTKFSESEPGIIASKILEALEPLKGLVAPTQKLENDQANLLHSVFYNIVKRNGLEAGLMTTKNSDIQQEIFGIMLGIEKKLPPFEQLKPNARNVLYVDLVKGYTLIQDGKGIFLQGKPFALNNPFKIEIKSLSLASKNEYNLVKERLDARKIWGLIQQVKYTDKTLIEELTSIIYTFANANGITFNEFFSIEKAQELEISLSQDLDISEVSINDEEYINHLVFFFLFHNEEIFNRLNLLGTATDSAYEKFSEFAKAHGLVNEERNLGFLHEIMPKLKALKNEKPELFYADTSLELLEVFGDKNLYTYPAQKASALELDKLHLAIRDNKFLFNRYTVVEAENSEKHVSRQRQKEVDDYVANINDNDNKEYMPKLDEGDKRILEEKKKAGFNLQLLKDNKVNGISLADHYVSKLKAFYEMIGLTEDEIPEHPVNDNGEELNPVLGKKIKAYLAQNRHIFKLNEEHSNSEAMSMFTSKAVTPSIVVKPSEVQVSSEADELLTQPISEQVQAKNVIGVGSAKDLRRAETDELIAKYETKLKALEEKSKTASDDEIPEILALSKSIRHTIKLLNQSTNPIQAKIEQKDKQIKRGEKLILELEKELRISLLSSTSEGYNKHAEFIKSELAESRGMIEQAKYKRERLIGSLQYENEVKRANSKGKEKDWKF